MGYAARLVDIVCYIHSQDYSKGVTAQQLKQELKVFKSRSIEKYVNGLFHYLQYVHFIFNQYYCSSKLFLHFSCTTKRWKPNQRE